MNRLLCGLALALALAGPARASSDVDIAIVPTVQASAYTANYALGALQTINAFRDNSAPSGIIDYLSVGWQSGLTTAVTVYVFDKYPANTTCNDKAAFSLGTAPNSDVAKIVPGFPVTLTPAVLTGATPSAATQAVVASVNNQDLPPTLQLYVCFVAAAVTPASTSDFAAKISISRD